MIANNRLDAANYVVELDHEGGKGLLMHKDKIAVFAIEAGTGRLTKQAEVAAEGGPSVLHQGWSSGVGWLGHCASGHRRGSIGPEL